MILLDTCALLWLVGGSRRLSQEIRGRIDEEAVVGVLSVSAFEIGLKYRAGKLQLPTPPSDWWAAAVEHHSLDVIPLGARVSIRATELPPIHRDPVDRFIIAAALAETAPVVTADARFAEYGVTVLC